jgi:hypothetical protein
VLPTVSLRSCRYFVLIEDAKVIAARPRDTPNGATLDRVTALNEHDRDCALQPLQDLHRCGGTCLRPRYHRPRRRTPEPRDELPAASLNHLISSAAEHCDYHRSGPVGARRLSWLRQAALAVPEQDITEFDSRNQWPEAILFEVLLCY